MAGRSPRRQLLPVVWSLYDCRDVEATARAALVVAIRRWNPSPPLCASEFEDTLRHLLGEVHRFEQSFDVELVRRPGYVLGDARSAGRGTSQLALFSRIRQTQLLILLCPLLLAAGLVLGAKMA
jgi:hypothetical protein